MPLDGFPSDPVLIDGAIWVPTMNPGPGELERIDQATNRVTKRVPVDGMTQSGPIVVDDGAVWLSDFTTWIKAIPLAELQGS